MTMNDVMFINNVSSADVTCWPVFVCRGPGYQLIIYLYTQCEQHTLEQVDTDTSSALTLQIFSLSHCFGDVSLFMNSLSWHVV